MDSGLYKGIKDGDITALEQADLSQKTVTGNTALHLAVQYQKVECAERILEKCPSLLWSQNNKGDTALHIAARITSKTMTELLLSQEEKANDEPGVMLESGGSMERSRRLARILNEAKDTAMHEVARNRRRGDDEDAMKERDENDEDAMKERDEIGERLIKADQEYEYMANAAGETPLYLAAENPYKRQEYEYMANAAGETPLYLAAENPYKRYWGSSLTKDILETWPCAAHDGPDGMTALHAAVMCDNRDDVIIILGKKPDIAGHADKRGWTALHYAAARPVYAEVTRPLLEHDSTLALRQADESGMTPLHVAASYWNINAVGLFLELCPESQEVVDNKGHNFLHTAVMMGNERTVKECLAPGYLTSVIINQPDNDGNTPLHLAALHKKYGNMNALLADSTAKATINFTAINKEGLTPLGVFMPELKNVDGLVYQEYWDVFRPLYFFTGCYLGRTKDYDPPKLDDLLKEDRKSRKEKAIQATQKIQQVSDNHLVVATLIATVAFAAGFALPGGYKNDGKDEGMATLLRRASFQAFVITNTMAMIFSSFAVLIHFVLKLIEDAYLTSSLLIWAFWSTIAAIIAMTLAFVTGTYSVLAHAPGLAISACTVGCTFYLFSGLLLVRRHKDIKFSFLK